MARTFLQGSVSVPLHVLGAWPPTLTLSDEQEPVNTI